MENFEEEQQETSESHGHEVNGEEYKKPISPY